MYIKNRVCLLAVLLITAFARAFTGGDGAAGNPYQISTAEQLKTINNDLSANYILINDIDLTGITYTHSVIASGISSSYQFQGIPFSGSFNGNGFKIENLTINGGPGNDNVGLFGYICGGTVTNLTLEQCNISGGYAVGGLVGFNEFGTINGCSVSGTISGTENSVGGLAGHTSVGTIINCRTAVNIIGKSAGGLAGYNWFSSITDCHTAGTINGEHEVGGLIGENDEGGTITHCYSTCDVNGSGGGLVGNNNGTITNCYAAGTISGTINSAGGLIGYNAQGGTVTNCYATGNVSGLGYLGGFAYSNYGTITNCYATGNINGSGGGLVGSNGGKITNCYSVGNITGSEYTGGLAYSNSGMIINCFWNTETSGRSVSAGGYPKTTAQMILAATFAGWNDGNWIINDGFDYPRLSWDGASGNLIETDLPQATYSGHGTQQSPFIIATSNDLVSMSERVYDWDKYFVLADNIDMTNRYYFPPADFSGNFDGGGFEIMNLTITTALTGIDSQLGLFGKLSGSVRNLGISNAAIEGSSYIGALAAICTGTITNCHAAGNINGSGYTGGLTGYNTGAISYSYNAATVNGTSYVGGLAGYSSQTIAQSYNAGPVSGKSYVGGLLGYGNGGTIINCFSTGTVSGIGMVAGLAGFCNSVAITNCYAAGGVKGSSYVGGLLGKINSGTVTNCFWDTQASGRNTSAGGTGKTTAQMFNYATFTTAGWDLGWSRSQAWTIDGWYPILSWQRYAADFNKNGIVDIEDLIELSNQWLYRSTPADINRDNMVDLLDYAALAAEW